MNSVATYSSQTHDPDSVRVSDLNLHSFGQFFFSDFSLVLVLIERIYQTLKTLA